MIEITVADERPDLAIPVVEYVEADIRGGILKPAGDAGLGYLEGRRRGGCESSIIQALVLVGLFPVGDGACAGESFYEHFRRRVEAGKQLARMTRHVVVGQPGGQTAAAAGVF